MSETATRRVTVRVLAFARLRELLGFGEKQLLCWANVADRMRIKGISKEYAELLQAAGVDTVKELKYRNPSNLAKAMADAAVSEGIPRDLALRMALKTIRGAEHLMRESKREVADLIRTVASPGGTTEAALRRFAEHGFSDIVAAALHAASDRSRELGRGIN